jgi:hypothetical protein
LASRSPQALSADHFSTRVSNVPAASNKMPLLWSISPD